MAKPFQKVVKATTARIPITGHNKSGLNATGVPKTPANAVLNPNQRKPFGT